MKHGDDIASATDSTGHTPNLFALAWAMLRQLMWLFARRPGDILNTEKLIAKLERDVCFAIFQQARTLDPSISPDDADCLRINPITGELEIVPGWRPDEQSIAETRAERLRYIRYLRALRLIHRNRTITGEGYRRRRNEICTRRFERRIANPRRIFRSHRIASRVPIRAPRVLAPP